MKTSFISLISAIGMMPCLLANSAGTEVTLTTKAIYAKMLATAKAEKDLPAANLEVTIPAAKNAKLPLLLCPIANEKNPFWIGKYEVTWDLYLPFMESGKNRNKDGTINTDGNMRSSEPPTAIDSQAVVNMVTQPTPAYTPMHFSMGDGYSKDFPATGMTLHAARKFCEWLSAQTGHFYRLPTGAEWECACRAGTSTRLYSGDDLSKLSDIAWFSKNSHFQYQKIGTKAPNAWGLFDMLGNVAEYVSDQQAVRGGHWDADAEAVTCSSKIDISPDWQAQDPQSPKSIWYLTDAPWVGIRVVRSQQIPSIEDVHRAWNAN